MFLKKFKKSTRFLVLAVFSLSLFSLNSAHAGERNGKKHNKTACHKKIKAKSEKIHFGPGPGKMTIHFGPGPGR